MTHSLIGWGARQNENLEQPFTTGGVNGNLLSHRTHCPYVFRGREKSLEDAKLDYGPLQLSIVREAILSHYELYKIAGILRSGTLPSCL